MTRLVLALLASLTLAPPARPDIGPAGAEFQVNAYTTGHQFAPSVCRSDAGQLVVVFGSSLLLGDVFARRYTSDGIAQGTELLVNAVTAAEQEQAVACAGNGDFVVVWQRSDGDDYGIFGHRFTSAGAAMGTEFQANTHSTDFQSRPSVAMDTSGRFVVVWQSESQDGDGYGVFGQRYASDGTRAGDEFRVNTYTIGAQASPAVAVMSDGGFVVAWRSLSQDGDGYGVFAQRYAADGVPVGAEFRVNGYTTGGQDFPAVARDPSGGFVVAWASQGHDGDGTGIFAQRYAADGSPDGAEFGVNGYTTGNQTFPAVAPEGNSGFVVTWRSGGQDGSGTGVFVRRFDAAGTPRGDEFRANAYTTGDQSLPSIAADRDGDFVVAWQSDGQDGDGRGIFAQRYADPCGDGVVGPGEECDDGSRIDGPCCTATCQAAPTTTACDDEGIGCTTDACDGAGACGHVAADTACPACRRCDAAAGCVVGPRADCRRPGRATLALVNKASDAKDRLRFAWRRGTATPAIDFGALPAAPDYTLCLFDEAAGADRLVAGPTVPAGRGWKKRGKGFHYRSRGAPGGITGVVLRRGAAGKASVAVAGKGAALALGAFPLTAPVTAQLQASGSDGACFAGTFAKPKKASATMFRAKGR